MSSETAGSDGNIEMIITVLVSIQTHYTSTLVEVNSADDSNHPTSFHTETAKQTIVILMKNSGNNWLFSIIL